MRRLLIALALAALPLGGQALETHDRVITRDVWPPLAHSDALLAIPALRDMLELFSEQPGVRLIIRHPGEAFGRDWAHGLRGWLVANGVPIDYIHLQVGAKRADQLQLLLERP